MLGGLGFWCEAPLSQSLRDSICSRCRNIFFGYSGGVVHTPHGFVSGIVYTGLSFGDVPCKLILQLLLHLLVKCPIFRSARCEGLVSSAKGVRSALFESIRHPTDKQDGVQDSLTEPTFDKGIVCGSGALNEAISPVLKHLMRRMCELQPSANIAKRITLSWHERGS